MSKPLASIIINNYNYRDFLSQAIESALNQSYQPLEVIVVDDGSTDGSEQIIASYGKAILSILKENGGQGSAFNAGFAASQGEIICFLDADDILLPSAIERATELFYEPDVAKVHWPLQVIDRDGKMLQKLIPEKPLPEEGFRELNLKLFVEDTVSCPTSGNAWSRRYLEKVLPLPEVPYRFYADSYLICLVPLFGSIKRITDYQGLYRIHGNNGTKKHSFRWQLDQHGHHVTALREYLQQQGIQVEEHSDSWEDAERTYLQHLVDVGHQLQSLVPPGQAYILVDMDEWGSGQLLEHCQSIPFLERNGLYWGAPSNDAIAIQEFERLHTAEINFIVFGYPAFWWLEYYTEFNHYLRSRFRCVLDNENLIVFELQLAADPNL
ncbi:glycosyltransferase family 2 protein [Cyanobacteria bacterium FACHB-63]|nr:glycosyltransferase family 2 protein [Cyanobacteria bacterium FACHB-63]